MKKILKKYPESFAPNNREYKQKDNYKIESVRNFLTRYLNDEYEVLNDVEPNVKRYNHKIKRFVNISPHVDYLNCFNETQTILMSAAIISTRVILKYCKGEKPHRDRVKIWHKSLKIASSLEECGLLPEKKVSYYICNGYIFRCWVYNVDILENVILTECVFKASYLPETVGDYGRPPLYFGMPPLLENTGGSRLKKRASKLIADYNENH